MLCATIGLKMIFSVRPRGHSLQSNFRIPPAGGNSRGTDVLRGTFDRSPQSPEHLCEMRPSVALVLVASLALLASVNAGTYL